MSGLHFGLNIKKKGGPVLAKPRPAAARPPGGINAFNNHSSDEEDNLDQDDEQPSNSKSTTRASLPAASISRLNSTASVNKTLRPYTTSTSHSSSVVQVQNEALAQDATVFDYDGVYDQLKAGDRAKELARKQDSLDRKPKYVNALLQAAEVRKRDRQIAEEKKIEREREQEGIEFAGKEKFITPAYKAQKEAMRLAEEEDRKKEELAAKDTDGTLMQGFYRSMLDQRTQLMGRGGPVEAGGVGSVSVEAIKALEEEKKLKEEEAKEKAREARERGQNVVVNEEGQVVDKRELLKGGLNIIRKKPPVPLPSSSSSSSRPGAGGRDHRYGDHRPSSYDRDRAYAEYKDSKYKSSSSRSGHHRGEAEDDRTKDQQRSRMTEQIERQLMEQEKKKEEEEKERQDSIREALKRKNADDQVMDAKARYLARKKAATASGGAST